MKADFTEYRLQRAFDVGKRAPCDEGSNLATQVADRRSTCFGGGAIRIADREPRLASTWTFGERATLIAFHYAGPHVRSPSPYVRATLRLASGKRSSGPPTGERSDGDRLGR